MPSGEALNLIFFLSFPFAQQHPCPPGAEPVPHIPVPVCDVLAWGWLTAAAQIIIWAGLTWQLPKRGEDEAQDAFFIAPASSLPARESQGGMQDAERLADPKPFGAADPRSISGGLLWSRMIFLAQNNSQATPLLLQPSPAETVHTLSAS